MGPRAGNDPKLKRTRVSVGEREESSKKPRRSQRLSEVKTPVSQKQHLPSPVTNQESSSSCEAYKDGTATPPEDHPSHGHLRAKSHDKTAKDLPTWSSPPHDTQLQTQLMSQFMSPSGAISDDVKDEVKEGVWGYPMPLDQLPGKPLVLKRRNACPKPDTMDPSALRTGTGTAKNKQGRDFGAEEEAYEKTKFKGVVSGGYLIGRHPECDLIIDDPIVSNRHCLVFSENKAGDSIAIIEDLSSNGTYVNDAIIGRNKRRELQEFDEITVLDKARFVFRYPKNRETSAFLQQYTLLEKLGKGHFAEVYLCIQKSSGLRFAVKVFTKKPGSEERSKTEGLQQEIAVLMGVSHPNMLCLKDTFDEGNAVYLVLELAAEGELFNWIVMKQKLTEDETRKIFVQLFQGVKYLHERGIVHRDIKPENILMTDRDLHVKLADFGLAKIIGEESFTTTLCGTPSYVAPEILEDSRHRRYTRAVDIWSLGVVLYICLCGFPPFSDELYTTESPYTLTQQIKMGKFDYPSPYWDSVGDPALDLIDRMLTVDTEKRFDIDQCLQHPWTTCKPVSLHDSTEGLVAGIGSLDFSKRKVQRERTLLSSLNDVKITRVIDLQADKDPVKVYIKNPSSKQSQNCVNHTKGDNKKGIVTKANGEPKAKKGAPKSGKDTEVTKPDVEAARKRELRPDEERAVKEFVELGGKGDQDLFDEQGASAYSEDPKALENTLKPAKAEKC